MSIEDIIVFLEQFGLKFVPMKTKPWGYTFGIQAESISKFADIFFPTFNITPELLSPRFVVVNDGCRLSLQKHARRRELWKVVKGPVGVVVGDDDKMETEQTGSIIQIRSDTPHRLVGLESIGIVAETWVHLDINNPSDANDIIRLKDDYKRPL